MAANPIEQAIRPDRPATNNWPKLKMLAPSIAELIGSMDPGAKLQMNVDGSVAALTEQSRN
ncbi:hypothetical protein U0C82_05430 [Fulvimarina sp. 2208YS6-2-32]|uniref:Uncharacterized protein n=1 Tax=Fulvimarina uroteuthidis TaxID=3098149 RepID=A0ABU5I059_9HYPH|nr:hypothetical protein [Fulvimarina sp. 2208YS6-2-32]MDY8108596.1 hypothetical protein [Fulvimarina sp. 2208YS6-2-32]